MHWLNPLFDNCGEFCFAGRRDSTVMLVRVLEPAANYRRRVRSVGTLIHRIFGIGRFFRSRPQLSAAIRLH